MQRGGVQAGPDVIDRGRADGGCLGSDRRDGREVGKCEGRSWRQGIEGGKEGSEEAHKASTCGFLTDVEGNWDYFQRYVELSEVLEWADRGKTKLSLRDD
eukprot:16065-Rhodomonas_salina.1